MFVLNHAAFLDHLVGFRNSLVLVARRRITKKVCLADHDTVLRSERYHHFGIGVTI